MRWPAPVICPLPSAIARGVFGGFGAAAGVTANGSRRWTSRLMSTFSSSSFAIAVSAAPAALRMPSIRSTSAVTRFSIGVVTCRTAAATACSSALRSSSVFTGKSIAFTFTRMRMADSKARRDRASSARSWL
jgi:hypothetical protein